MWRADTPAIDAQMSAFLRCRYPRAGARGCSRGQLPYASRTRTAAAVQSRHCAGTIRPASPNRKEQRQAAGPLISPARSVMRKKAQWSYDEIRRRSYATALYALGPSCLGAEDLLSEWLAGIERAQRRRAETSRVRDATALSRCHLIRADHTHHDLMRQRGP